MDTETYKHRVSFSRALDLADTQSQASSHGHPPSPRQMHLHFWRSLEALSVDFNLLLVTLCLSAWMGLWWPRVCSFCPMGNKLWVLQIPAQYLRPGPPPPPAKLTSMTSGRSHPSIPKEHTKLSVVLGNLYTPWDRRLLLSPLALRWDGAHPLAPNRIQYLLPPEAVVRYFIT